MMFLSSNTLWIFELLAALTSWTLHQLAFLKFGDNTWPRNPRTQVSYRREASKAVANDVTGIKKKKKSEILPVCRPFFFVLTG